MHGSTPTPVVRREPFGARSDLTSMRDQAMGPHCANTCTSCGRRETAMRSCPGNQYQCTSCLDERVARHQISFGKLHITKHKLPHTLAMHVYRYVHGQASHRHSRRRILFALLLQGKVEAPSSLATLHNSLSTHINAWHQLGMFGPRANLYTKLTDLVIGPDTRQARPWCPWCHGTGCG